MTLGFHLKAYHLSRKSLLKPSDLEGKSSASWPEGNFFLLFTSLWEAAAQTHYCLESRAHKMGGWGWSRAEGGRKKIIKKKRDSELRPRENQSIVSFGASCMQACVSRSAWLKLDPWSTPFQPLLFSWGQTHATFPDGTIYFMEAICHKRHCRTPRKVGDGIRVITMPVCLWLLLILSS